MAGERESRFVIAFDGAAGDLPSVINAIKGQFKNAVAEIEQTTRKVVLFSELETKTKASAEALFDATTKAKLLGAELEKIKTAGGKATEDLTKGLRDANREVTTATNAYNRNVDALTKMQRALTAAGVDTSNLARAQLKLAEAEKIATAAAEQQAAKQLLGVKTLADIQPQIQKLQNAYQTLKDSGALSTSELAAAHNRLNAKVAETRAEVTTLEGAWGKSFKGSGATLQSMIGPLLAISAALGTVKVLLLDSAAAAREFESSMARIGTITKLNQEELNALGEEAKSVALELGVNLKTATEGLYELLRTGIPKENVIDVLRTAAIAAKGAVEDASVGVKAVTVLFDAWGIPAESMAAALDKIAESSAQGGATLREFGDATADLGLIARASGQNFDEVLAALTLMTDKTNDAGGSAASLARILVQLNTPKVREGLRGMGIEATNLAGILTELGNRNIGLETLLELGVGSKKSAAGIAALTLEAGTIPKLLDEIGNASGKTGRDFEKMSKTATSSVAKLSAAWDVFLTGLGNNSLSNAFTNVTAGLVRWIATGSFGAATKELSAGASEAAAGMEKLGAASRKTELDVKNANASLSAAAKALIEEVQALQAASTRDVSDINARADAQIAALDRTAQATAATAAKTIEIQTKAAADRLAIIQKNEAAVLAAVTAATAAREQAQRASGIGEKAIAAETAKIRIDALAPILAQYQAHYGALVQLAQGHLAKINSIEQERITFNEGIEKTLFDIRLGGLSALDQYAAKVKEIDRLISEARKAGVDGDIATAKKYTDQAIALSQTLKEAVNKDGVVVVSAFEAQQKAISEIKKASDAYNESLSKQDDLAKDGLTETQKGLDAVVPKIEDLQKRYDALKATIADGLNVQVTLDEASVSASLATINELTQPRTVVITTQTVQGNSGGGPVVAPFARGGPVGRIWEAAQRFAGGGSVFRRPTWSKVPGSGNADTVPAALQTGSFVLRKAASRFYGDAAMQKIAKGYALGGSVPALRGITLSDNPGSGKEYKEYAETLSKLLTLQEASRGGQKPFAPYINLGTWASRLIENWDFFSKPHRDEIKNLLQRSYEGWIGGIQAAAAQRVPIAMDLSLLGILQRYAGGGDVDTVPAMLTPGEYVVNRSRVGEFGSGFMHALNSMAVSRETLAAMLYPTAPRPPVARFATGGMVGITASASGRGTPSNSGAITVNVNAAAGSLLSEDNVRRFILPVLNSINRKSR